MGVEPIAVTSAMANGVVDFTGGAVLWSLLLALLAASAAGVLLAGVRPRYPRPARLARPARTTPLAESAK